MVVCVSLPCAELVCGDEAMAGVWRLPVLDAWSGAYPGRASALASSCLQRCAALGDCAVGPGCCLVNERRRPQRRPQAENDGSCYWALAASGECFMRDRARNWWEMVAQDHRLEFPNDFRLAAGVIPFASPPLPGSGSRSLRH